jgi:hypothetical protein
MSEALDVEYRGHFIQVRSYESADRRWRPKAVVVAYRAGSLQKQTLTAGPETVYDSEDAADTSPSSGSTSIADGSSVTDDLTFFRAA